MPRTRITSRKWSILAAVLRLFLLLALLTLSACGVVWLLIQWHWPAVVELSVTVNRATFHAHGINSPNAPILQDVAVQSVSIDSFDKLQLHPLMIEVADPAQYDVTAGRFKDSAWHPLTLKGNQVVISAGEKWLNPRVTVLSNKATPDGLISLYPLLVKSNSSVILQVPTQPRKAGSPNSSDEPEQPIELRVAFNSREPYQELLIHDSVQLNVQHCHVEGIQDPIFRKQSLSYRLSLPESEPAIGIRGLPDSLGLVLKVPPKNPGNIFANAGLTITNPEFIRESLLTKGKESSLVETTEAVVTYPDYPKADKVLFKAPDSIWLDNRGQLTVKELRLRPEAGGIHMLLTGKVKGFGVGVPGLEQKEHYISAFTVLQHNPMVLALLAVVGWVVPTALSIRKFTKELAAEVKQTSDPTNKKTRPAKAER